MPPKSKKKDKKQKKITVSLDNVDTSVLTREKLEEFCINVQGALTKEKQYSDFLRLDRDKLVKMVAISREQLKDLRVANLTKDYELQEIEASHRHDMAESRQKLINLASDKNIERLTFKTEALKTVQRENTCHEERMIEITSDINKLKTQRIGLQQVYCVQTRKLETEHAENLSEIHQKDKELQVLMENKREKIVNDEIETLNQRFLEDTKNLNQRKNKEVSQLIISYSKFTHDLYHYYGKIVQHNSNVILEMKSTLEELKASTALSNKDFVRLKEENDFLKTNLSQLKIQEGSLCEKLSSSKRDQMELIYTKIDLDKRTFTMNHMKWELEALKIGLDKQKEEVNEQIESDQLALFSLKTKATELVLILELLATHLFHRICETEAALIKMRNICERKAKWTAVTTISGLEMLSQEEHPVDDTNYRLAMVAEDRDQVLHAYRELLRKYHIPEDNTGFTPLRVEDILNKATSLKILING